jgi:hypothetical protein
MRRRYISGEKWCLCSSFGDGFFDDDDDDEGQSGHDELKKRGKTSGGGAIGDEEGRPTT